MMEENKEQEDKSLNFIVRLSGKDAFGRDAEMAVVQVPRALPRIIRVLLFIRPENT